ncbi:hypothetical protein CJF32_00010770 [Rutstroemia sp. NJR-2017a WRK4]|nr:hypothetical protein CJF32_00010770 [Rutstroemia sp. NJR-2017a WRK4]
MGTGTISRSLHFKFTKFQDTILSGLGCRYYISVNKVLKGSEADRKLDIFLASTDTVLLSGEHDYWQGIYIRCSEVNRSGDSSLVLQSMEIFDRSGLYNSEKFDIYKEPERFIRVITGYILMTDTELGLNIFVKHNSNNSIRYENFFGGQANRLDKSDKQYIIEKGGATLQNKKFAWPSDKRQQEGELLKLAKKKGVTVWIFDGLSTSKHKALRYSTFAYYLDRLGWAAGFVQKLTSYCFRRGTENAVDRAATTAVRDQVMRHNPQTGVFCRSYINEKVRFIVQDAVLDQPTDVGFLHAFSHINLTCDPHAPIDMPEEIRKALPPDPEIMELTREHKEYKRQYRSYSRAPPEICKEYEQLRQQINSFQKQRDRAVKIEFRRDYFEHIHNKELERQLKKVPTNKYIEPIVCHQLPERTRLQQVLCNLSRDMNQSDIVSRRICAIDLIVALSYRQEQETRYSNRSSRASSESSEEQSLCEDPFPLLCKKTQCIICIGDGRNTYEYRTRTYATPHKMMNHMESHLKDVPESQRLSCTHPVCRSEGLVLKHLQHFKNHVQTVHGISLRS